MNLVQRCMPLQLLLLDVDGVLTDGSIVLDAQGLELKRFHVRDGSAIKFWQQAGGTVGIVSGRKSQATEHRARELGITQVYQGVDDKWQVVRNLMSDRNLLPEAVCFVGDDLADLGPVMRVGLGVAVADAAAELRAAAQYVTSELGGHGAVRETIEMILKAQGRWDAVLERHSRVTH